MTFGLVTIIVFLFGFIQTWRASFLAEILFLSHLLKLASFILQERFNVRIIKDCLNFPLTINFASFSYFNCGTTIIFLSFLLRFGSITILGNFITFALFIFIFARLDIDHSDRRLKLILWSKIRKIWFFLALNTWYAKRNILEWFFSSDIVIRTSSCRVGPLSVFPWAFFSIRKIYLIKSNIYIIYFYKERH